MVPVNTTSTINSGFHKDERYQLTNAVTNQRQTRSMLGYSQVINSMDQVVPGVRTQLVIDALGDETFSTEALWNPINNRINLQDAVVDDYIDADLILTFVSAGLVQTSAQLDFSPALDGSQTIGPAQVRLIFSSGTFAEAFHYTFKFIVTAPMKENGIGIMVTPSGALTLQNNRLMIERLTSTTEEN